MLLTAEETIRESADKYKCNQQKYIHQIITVGNGIEFCTSSADMQSRYIKSRSYKASQNKILKFILSRKSPKTVIEFEKIEYY
jgi:hypothetical protein